MCYLANTSDQEESLRSQQGCDGAEVADELPVVAGEAEEAAQDPSRVRCRLGGDSGHLVAVDGDAVLGDDVAEVSDRRRPEKALRALEVEVLRP